MTSISVCEMIWVKLSYKCDCKKCKGAARYAFVDFAEVTDFTVSHDADNYFPIYAWSGNKPPLPICIDETLAAANKKLEKIIGYITLLNANYPNLVGYYESVDDFIADCEKRFFNESQSSQKFNTKI